VIDEYKFGEIVVDGRVFTNDIIIYPDHVEPKWWRKQGHVVEPEDITDVFDLGPEIIVFGTGQPGLMQVSSGTMAEMKRLRIEAMIMPTEQACSEYNNIARTKKVVACLHLTC